MGDDTSRTYPVCRRAHAGGLSVRAYDPYSTSGAIVINIARGPLLDLDAALDALAAGHLGGLALGALDTELPAPAEPS